MKKEQEAERKVREAKKRRNARFNRRSPQEDVTSKMQETLFIIGKEQRFFYHFYCL